MRLCLYQPEIAGNVGAVMRLGACLALPVDLIAPLGFVWDDARVRRAAMDYVDHVDVTHWPDWAAYRAAQPGRIVLATTRATTRLHDFAFGPDDAIVFGQESAGVPDAVAASCDYAIRVPIAPAVRSLNLAVTAAIVAGEALRQTGGFPR